MFILISNSSWIWNWYCYKSCNL